ncbi:MAG: hypothetical protein CM15mP85_17330 [Rhodobacterales bacterium]|nr:MAG: hypothetical protein CM15mP85_17330 [Rhodobacterales bacterium]
MDHFLEVFNPAFTINTGDADIGTYINDSIVRCLAGLERLERPLFLKIQYNGARAMAELAEFDPTNLVVGILGGVLEQQETHLSLSNKLADLEHVLLYLGEKFTKLRIL